MFRTKSLPLQLKIDQRLADRNPRSFWKRWYQRVVIRVSTLRWCQWFAILLGMLYGWLNFYFARGLSDPTHWNLLNNPGIFPWLWPANLPPIRSVLFVGTFLQLATIHWFITVIPAWRDFQETQPIDDEGDKLPGSLYCRLPLSMQSVVAMLSNEMPWRFRIVLTKSTVISFYLLLFLAYDGRLGLAPIVLGTMVGLVQAWVSFHVWMGMWAMQDYLRNSDSLLGRLYRSYSAAGVTTILVAIPLGFLILPRGWWAWLFPLPPLILDPNHPQATFGGLSGSIYYLTVMLLPTGWLHALLEPVFDRQTGLGFIGLLPLLGLAMVHWRYGHYLWSIPYLNDPNAEANNESVHQVAGPTSAGIVGSTTPIMENLCDDIFPHRLPPATTQQLEHRPMTDAKMPAGGCAPFASAPAELARKIFLPRAHEQERVIGSSVKRHVPLSGLDWYVFPGLLVMQLVLSRIKGAPADFLYLTGIIGIHGLFSMSLQVWGPVEYKRALLTLPIHADWLIALWVQSCWRWSVRWLGILAITWVPMLQWVDRIGMAGVSLRLLMVVLCMNCVAAGLIFLRSLAWWTDLAKAQRIGFFDFRPNNLLREFYLTIGTLFWAATHIAIVLEFVFAAPVWIIAIQLVISSICSWHLLYGLKHTNLYGK